MPTEHAKLSASSAYRWINCPGSVALAEQCPPAGSSSYADEGTLAHALAEWKLRRFLGDAAAGDRELADIQSRTYYCGEMEEATDFYANTVFEELAAAGGDAVLLVEQRLDMSRWVPQGFGTGDAVILCPARRYIQVIDLKYGKGVKVQAANNPQLRLYGLGAADLFGYLYDFDAVWTTIVQPRLDHVSSEVIPLKELLIWAEEEVAPRARMAMEGTDYLAAGDWCRWCPAKAVCRQRAAYNLELAKDDFKEPPLLTQEEIGDILRRAEEVQRWVSDVQAYALEEALAGRQFDGWKLVEGRSTRKYADEIKAADVLKAAGYDEALLYERRLCGITAMEKLVGKKKLAAVLGDLLIKPAGKPVLVPETDKREAIHTTEAAKADFANNEDENVPQF